MKLSLKKVQLKSNNTVEILRHCQHAKLIFISEVSWSEISIMKNWQTPQLSSQEVGLRNINYKHASTHITFLKVTKWL